MGEVTITINGRPYRMACEDGQEDHLRGLGDDLAARVQDLSGQVGQANDAQLLVMAALITADEVRELSRNAVGGEEGERAETLEQELETVSAANASLLDELSALREANARLEAAAAVGDASVDAENARADLTTELDNLRAELETMRQERAAQSAVEANAAAAIESLSGRVARLAEAL